MQSRWERISSTFWASQGLSLLKIKTTKTTVQTALPKIEWTENRLDDKAVNPSVRSMPKQTQGIYMQLQRCSSYILQIEMTTSFLQQNFRAETRSSNVMPLVLVVSIAVSSFSQEICRFQVVGWKLVPLKNPTVICYFVHPPGSSSNEMRCNKLEIGDQLSYTHMSAILNFLNGGK